MGFPTWLAAGLRSILLCVLASVLGRGGLLLLAAQHLILVLQKKYGLQRANSLILYGWKWGREGQQEGRDMAAGYFIDYYGRSRSGKAQERLAAHCTMSGMKPFEAST